MKIGKFELRNQLIAAPMAGVSDKPFREACRRNGAGMAVSEMVTSRLDLHHSTKTRFRLDHSGESGIRSVQIVGTDPAELALAAQFNVEQGAQIIDINMGCPAKKVCKKAAGSALLGEPDLVDKILNAVVAAVEVPVTLKIRTGVSPSSRNGVTIAKIAETAGVSALTVHGRTKECKFVGAVEYDTIAAIKQAVGIPIIANGDIDSIETAKRVLKLTQADALMLGRAAQGSPWIFDVINQGLSDGSSAVKIPSRVERRDTILTHIEELHQFYGERLGIKFSRKHIKWYLQKWDWPVDKDTLLRLTTTESTVEQIGLLKRVLSESYGQQELDKAA